MIIIIIIIIISNKLEGEYWMSNNLCRKSLSCQAWRKSLNMANMINSNLDACHVGNQR